jgi:penicillin-binding protein 2
MSHSDRVQNNFEYWRLIVIYVIGALVFSYFLYRLFSLQIVQGAQYLIRADQNREETISLQTQRGIITDRNGFVLARNVASYNVVITPANLPTDEGATQEIYRQLSNLIDIPVSNSVINDATVKLFKPCDTDFGIKEIVYIGNTNAPFDPVQIKCNVDQKTAMIIQEKSSDWPGVSIQVDPVRDYPTGSLTSEIIGFLGPIPASEEQQLVNEGFVANRDKIGYAGVEQSLQDILAGKNGVRKVEVDVAGQIQRDLQQPQPAVPGNNVELTIDTRLQLAAKTAIAGEIDYYNKYLNKIFSTNGVVIAIKPKTGEILAMVSYPTYENNRMAKVIPSYYYQQLFADPDHPLLNHAVSAEYPPGSVFKMGAAIGALNEGVVTPEKTVVDPGHITIANKYSPNDPGKEQTFVCWLRTGHGIVDFLHGVAWSCDVYFYKIGGGFEDEVPNGGLGIYRLGEYAKALGYNRATGIELPGENSGLIPDPKWKRLNAGENWSTGDTYNATIGQGYVLATPLQVLMSYVTIANDGVLVKPTLVKQVSDTNGNVIQSVKPQVVWDITKDPLIHVFDSNNIPTGQMKTVQPWVLQELKQGLRMVTHDPTGTAYKIFQDETIQSAGKTGTAEYCDNIAQSKNLCTPGNWPAHAWYVGYAPYDNPEIVVLAFVYNGTEGSTVAAPVVRKVLDAYFELKAIDAASGTGGQ